MNVLYFDNNATTRPAPEVLEALLPYFTERFGNPSSLHGLGVEAAHAVASARAAVARLLGARGPTRIVFTSGGTESNQTAIRAALRLARPRKRVVTTAAEHSAVLEPLASEERDGAEVVRVAVDSQGRLELASLLDAIDERCALASVMWANNETGVVNDLAPIAARCREAGALLHVDAVQACGKLPMDVSALGLDLVSVSAHKLHGPKGVGALYVRPGLELEPLLRGGPQENERRGGTENVPGIVGFGRAAQLAQAWLASDGPAQLARRRDALETRLCAELPGTIVHAREVARVPNTSNVRFDDISGEAVVTLAADEGLCLSTGAACSSSRHRPSHVLLAMGLDAAQASSSVRFSLSRTTTDAEVERALAITASCVTRLRALQSSART
jgi:cysteine desulfurase